MQTFGIDLATVVSAYEATGLMAISGHWQWELDGTACGCPVDALVRCVPTWDGAPIVGASRILTSRGFTGAHRYIDGFVTGFDIAHDPDLPQINKSWSDDPAYQAGIVDGQLVAEQLPEQLWKEG